MQQRSNYIPSRVLLDDLLCVANRLRKTRLSQTDYSHLGLYSFITICRRFGCWHAAAVAAGLEPVRRYGSRHSRGPRSINVSLRFQILRRDRFRCRACGRSPATHPEVELEVDHIFPWSQGGSTRRENLQTLCNRCNRGKADSV